MGLSCVVLLAVLAAPGAEAPPWRLVNDGDGIKVWTREVPGSAIREIKAETTAEVPPPRVWAVLDDVDNYPVFMPYVLEARNLASFEDGHYEYQLIDPPLVSRREYTLKVSYHVDRQAGTYERRWSPANDRGPPAKEGVIRVEVNRGSWRLEPVEGGRTRIRYYLYTDPGGAIPDWIANKANTTSVSDLLTAVRKRALSNAK